MDHPQEDGDVVPRWRIILQGRIIPIPCSLIIMLITSLQNDEDYWLLSDREVPLTDMWNTDCDIEWDGVDLLSDDFGLGDVSTGNPSTPPADVSTKK
ncbi:putative E2F Family protein [Helianthus debilis subsp. tardiflorus]